MKNVAETLRGLDVPVSRLSYNGKNPTYITFFLVDDFPALHCDDKEKVSEQIIQVDIWSKSNYKELAKEVEKRMLDAGFSKLNYFEQYEKDTKIFHMAMRFTIQEVK